jgi:hypothetical protein
MQPVIAQADTQSRRHPVKEYRRGEYLSAEHEERGNSSHME